MNKQEVNLRCCDIIPFETEWEWVNDKPKIKVIKWREVELTRKQFDDVVANLEDELFDMHEEEIISRIEREYNNV